MSTQPKPCVSPGETEKQVVGATGREPTTYVEQMVRHARGEVLAQSDWLRIDDSINLALAYVREEYMRARSKHAPMRGRHEGFAVLLEEVDELKECVWRNLDNDRARAEAVQVAAMALAFVLEVTGTASVDQLIDDGKSPSRPASRQKAVRHG